LGSLETFAAGGTKDCYADKAAFCSCGYCWRSKCWHLQRWSFCGAALFTEPAVQTGRSWLFSKWPFSAAFS